MVDVIDADNMLNLFLYGSLDTPDFPQDRLRNTSPLIADPHIERYVNTASYMDSVGRFASLGDAKIVQDFFSGTLARSGVTGSDGVTRLTITSLLDSEGHPPTDAKFVISQYTAGVTEDDFALRAFIWGLTSFRISDQTTFVWDANGNRTIENGAIIPYDTNFDFQSESLAVQAINTLALAPVIDPYGIGQRVNLIFGAADKVAWEATKIGDVYTQSDYGAYSIPSYVYSDLATFITAGSSIVAGYAAGISGLITELQTTGAFTYTDEGGRDIIYGTSWADNLSYANHLGGLLSGSDPYTAGAYFVAGMGFDTVTGGANADILYGGEGNDKLYGGAEGDALYGGDGNDLLDSGTNVTLPDYEEGSDIVDGGAGNDILIMRGLYTNAYGGAGADQFWIEDTEGVETWQTIYDPDSSDSLYYNGYLLTGGTKVVLDAEGTKFSYNATVGALDSNGFRYTYWGDESILLIYSPDGGGIQIENFNNGDLGINVGDPVTNSDVNWVFNGTTQRWNIVTSLPLSSIAFDGELDNWEDLPGAASAAVNPGSFIVPDTFLI